MQTPGSAGTHDCFAHPDVAELTIELATIRTRRTLRPAHDPMIAFA
jgi:hypothetical protein